MQSCGIKHTKSAPYHPSTNGLAELLVQSVKQALKTSTDSGLLLSQRLCDFFIDNQSITKLTFPEKRKFVDRLCPNRETEAVASGVQHATACQFSMGDAEKKKL